MFTLKKIKINPFFILIGVTQLPYWRNNFPEWDTSNLSARLPNLCADGVDLVRQLLRYNPLTRITASGALKHPYIAPFSLSTSASSRSSLLCTPPPREAQEEQVRRYVRYFHTIIICFFPPCEFFVNALPTCMKIISAFKL